MTHAEVPPDPELVADGVWSVGIPMPVSELPYSLAWLVLDGSGSLHVIDPGWDSDEGWQALSGAVSATGRGIADVATVTITHLHRDHAGLADRLRAASGASVAMHAAEQEAISYLASGGSRMPDFAGWGVPAGPLAEIERAVGHREHRDLRADRLLVDGDALEVPGRELRVIHTPGHTPGSITVRAVEEKLLFTGDHLLPMIFSGLGLGGPQEDPVADFLASLERLVPFDDHEACPGHGYRFAGVADRCAAAAAHQRVRTDEIARIMAASPGVSTWDAASQVTWTAGWKNLHGRNLASALAQTAMRMRFVASD